MTWPWRPLLGAVGTILFVVSILWAGYALGMTLRDLANGSLLSLSVVQTGFTLQYLLRSPWWKSELGIIYATKSVVMTMVLWQVSASVMSQSQYPGREYWRLAIYIGGGLAMVWLWLALLRYQRLGRDARRAAGDDRWQWQIWRDELRRWSKW